MSKKKDDKFRLHCIAMRSPNKKPLCYGATRSMNKENETTKLHWLFKTWNKILMVLNKQTHILHLRNTFLKQIYLMMVINLWIHYYNIL